MHSFKRRRETFAGGYIDIDKKQGRLTSNGRTRKKTLLFKFVSVAMAIIMIGTAAVTIFSEETAKAEIYTFHQPTIEVIKPINFINGSFEEPSMDSDAVTPLVKWCDNAYTYKQKDVPGWKTYPVNRSYITNNNSYGYKNFKYSDFAFAIELQKSGHCIQDDETVYFASHCADGNQYAEINAEYPQRLNQTCATVPGSRIYWQFAHVAKPGQTTNSKNGIDVTKFYLRAGGNNGSVTPTNSNVMTTARTNGYGVSSSSSSDLKGAKVTNNENNKGWAYYRGAYTVPAGQTSTEFGWQVVSQSTSELDLGNYVDDIKLQTGSLLVVEKGIYNSSGTRIDGGYDEYNDTISIKIKVTNWGETDAAPCVLSDTLWDGLTYVSGSVSGDSGITGTVSCTNGVVKANIGSGATASVGGTIKGSQSMGTSSTTGKGQQAIVTIRAKITGAPGSTIKNQASVTYNDKNYESYNTNGLTSYSCVDYEISDAHNLGDSTKSGNYTMNILNSDGTTSASYSNVDTNNEDTYVNRFNITDREVDGTLWYDANENGNIDSSEIKLNGQTVKMQVTTDNGATWTDAKDWSGDVLITTTGTTGQYSFTGMLSGKYRVLANVDDAERVVNKKSSALPTEVVTTTGTQGNYDNDAQTATVTNNGSTWAVVQTLDKTTTTPVANTYYTHNVDFGIVPTISLSKGSRVTSSGSTNVGTQASPVTAFFGDTITYTLTVRNNSSNAGLSSGIISVSDTLPTGLTYVSSTLEGNNISPTQSGQTLTWSNIDVSLPAGNSAVITVTAKVTKSNVDLVNIATTTETDGTTTDSNKTYHHSYGLDLTITKTVAGDIGDLSKDFTFNISNLQSDTISNLGTLSYTGSSTVSGVAAPANGTFNSANGLTLTLKHGQAITIKDLPMQTAYKIAESFADGYVTTCTITNSTTNTGTANTGTFTAADLSVSGKLNVNNAKIDYVNTKDSVPQTGIDTGSINRFIPIAVALLALIAIVVISLILRHRKRHQLWIG
jgi:uncharacterized repeat protein (TIGR01451 family)